MAHGVTLTYPLIGVSVFARQLCLPVPAIFFLLAAGALVRSGELSVTLVLAVSVLGCIGGDLAWFEAGRRWGRRILEAFTGLSEDPRRASMRAHAVFKRCGLQSLMVAKFVPGLDGITPPLAGLEGASRSKFILFDGIGSLLWSGAYVLCGVLFARQIDRVLAIIESSGTILFAALLTPLAAYILWRALTIFRMVRKLRLRHISPKLLKSRLGDGEEIVVIDLLNFEESVAGTPGIAGAVRIDPARLRTRTKILAPAGLSVVLCCSSVDQFRSARVAMSLKRKGITEVWVLEGGLSAWTQEGFPVISELLTEDEVIRKFGLQILDGKRHSIPARNVAAPSEK